MIGVHGSSATSPIARIWARDESGFHAIGAGRVRGTTSLSAFFASMSASASEPATGYGNSATPVDIQTGNSFCTIIGGVAPYTYLWEAVSPTEAWTITQPTSDFTAFIAESVDSFDPREEKFKCTVTDAIGETAETDPVSARVINLGGS